MTKLSAAAATSSDVSSGPELLFLQADSSAAILTSKSDSTCSPFAKLLMSESRPHMCPWGGLAVFYCKGGWKFGCSGFYLGRLGSEVWPFSKLNNCIKKS